MPSLTKTVYLYVSGVASAIVWSTTSALATDVVSRWNAVRQTNGCDALVFVQGGYEYHLDLRKVSGMSVSV